MRQFPQRLMIGVLLLLVLLPQNTWASTNVYPRLPVVGRPSSVVSVLLELSDPPLVEAAREGALTTQATQRALQRIEARQQTLLVSLSQRGATLLYRTQRVYNGVAVAAVPQRIAEIARLPGVKAIHPLPVHRAALNRSVPFIGAPQLWQVHGLTGAGVRIGIIDTGIDYIHADFGGSGVTDDYTRNDVTMRDEIGLFPSTKIVGGYDFVGDDYDATSNDPTRIVPRPDADPMDCYGHGTHVAGIAAGAGVTAAGATYTGPYNTALDPSNFLIGPGVAPQAQLYALKVFGCGGSSIVILPAIEWAVDPNGDGDFGDRLDIINMSLGSSAAPGDDVQSRASDNAATAGVVVIAAAGNDGDAFYTSGGPCNAARVLCVAATNTAEDTLAGFSSRGPSSTGSILKPDIAAPGSSIISAGSETGNQARTLNGTSMATPHVAGGVALLRQLHPNWTTEELKALVMNTARTVRTSAINDTPAGFTRVGAGRLDLPNATATTLLAYNADGSGTVSISFGAPQITRTTTLTRVVTVANKGATSTTVSIGYTASVNMAGASYRVTPDTLTLGSQRSATVTVTLTLDPALLGRTRDPAVPETQFGSSRHWLSEASGDLTLTPAGAARPMVRLPVYAAPGRAAQMRAASSTLRLPDGPIVGGSLLLDGETISGALVSALELTHVSLMLSTAIGRNADLRYVGVTSDVRAAPSFEESTLYFGIATHSDWASPHQVEFDILLDTDRDGTDDYLLTDESAGSVSDVYVAALYRLPNRSSPIASLPLNGVDPFEADTAPFNTNVMLLPVRARDLALNKGNARFSYRVETYSTDRSDGEFSGDRVDYGAPIDTTPKLTYNANAPGLDFANRALDGRPIHPDTAGTFVPLTLTREAHRETGAQGVLLLHQHNAAGRRAEVVPIETPTPIAFSYQLHLPLVNR